MSKTLNLRVYRGEEFVRELTLTQDVVKIGRLRTSHLRLEDESVGRMHAVIENMDELRVIDLGASAGTVLNGERVPRNAVLVDGDILQFGPFRVVVYVADAEPAPPSPPPSTPTDRKPGIPKILRRLAALCRIAADQDGTPEGQNASRAMASLVASHSLDLPEGGLETFEVLCERKHDWDGDLAQLISRATHTETRVVDGKIRFRGIRVAVDEAVEHYERHRDTCERLVAFTAMGYMIGAFGAEAFQDYMREAQDVSSTIQAAQQEDESSPLDAAPTDAESKLIVAAGRVGKKTPATFWEKLKAKARA